MSRYGISLHSLTTWAVISHDKADRYCVTLHDTFCGRGRGRGRFPGAESCLRYGICVGVALAPLFLLIVLITQHVQM
jgi:hypothetical protein